MYWSGEDTDAEISSLPKLFAAVLVWASTVALRWGMANNLEIPGCVRQGNSGRSQIAGGMVLTTRLLPLTRVLCIGIFLAFCCIFVCSGIHPYVQAHRLGEQVDQVQKQESRALLRHSILTQRVAELKTVQGQQNAARMYGWVLKGEIAIACPRSANDLYQKTDDELLTAPQSRPTPFLERIVHFLEW